MPKLLQINIVSNLLSTGKISDGIASVAKAGGWETFVAYGRAAKPGASREIRVGSILDECEHYIEYRLFDNDGLASRLATRRLISHISKLKPDIIHLHVIHDHYLNYRLLFEYLNSIPTPVVWTMHDCWNFTGGCAYFDSNGCSKWKTRCFSCPEREQKLSDRTDTHYKIKRELFTAKKEMVLVPVSMWLGRLLSESFLKEKTMRVIHNGIDTSVFYPYQKNEAKRKFGLEDKSVVLGVASRWSQRKGLFDCLHLADVLGDSYQVVLVGLSDVQIRNLPSNVIGIRRTSNDTELAELYSASDVFVNPTYADNFPTTNIEALACGTPVVTYDTGGSPESLDEKTGVIVPQGDFDSLVEAVRRLMAKPLSSDDCRNRAVEFYDKNKCYKEYLRLYESLLIK